MNLILQVGSQHARFAVAQPLLRPPPAHYSVLCQQLAHHSWPLHQPNFYVQLDYLLDQWQLTLFQSIQRLAVARLQDWALTASFDQVNECLSVGLKIMKKMQFYRIGFNSEKLFYSNYGLLKLYLWGDLKSSSLLTEFEKYTPKQEASLSSQGLRMVEQEAIYRDVSLKIAKHVLSQFKTEMYITSQQLVGKLFNVYGFSYDFAASFQQNYLKALEQKQVPCDSQDSREALIIFFTFKILSSFSQDHQICCYLNYLKNVLLDRSSGVLTASYELWTLLYETSLRVYSRNTLCREQGWVEIDQILSSQLHDPQFQTFLLKNAQCRPVSLSSINFYLKNCKKEQRAELRPVVEAKIASFSTTQFWANIEDILQFVENEVPSEDRKSHIQSVISQATRVFSTHIPLENFYELEYGLAFALEAIPNYLSDFQTMLPEATLLCIQNILSSYDSSSAASVSLCALAFKYFDSFLSNVYTETDYSQWKADNLLKYLSLAQSFYKHGFVPSKSALKLIYKRLVQLQVQPQVWESLVTLVTEHYFCGSYEENSDLQLIQSRQIYSQLIANKILQYFQRLACSQQVQARQLAALLQEEKSSQLRKSYFGVRGVRDQLVFYGIQSISLVFSSHLSMQTLEFSLNYCSLFMSLPAWHPEEEGVSLLSLICEEMPIEVLKFAYQQLCSSESFGCWEGIEKIPVSVWSVFWGKSPSEVCFSGQLQASHLGLLQQLRKFQFVIDLSNCVFDKLNEQSQKNIKQIKLIFEGGALIAEQVISKIADSLLAVTCTRLIDHSKHLSSDELSELVLADDEDFIMAHSYVAANSLLKAVQLFNQMGRVTQSDKVSNLQKVILPIFPHISCEQQSEENWLICKYFELICTLESTWRENLVDYKGAVLSKDWVKQTTLLLQTLKQKVQLTFKERTEESKQKTASQKGVRTLEQKISCQVKVLLSKLMLPCALAQLLSGEDRNSSKMILGLMKAAIFMLNLVDPNYEEHFILQVETLQEILKEPSKASTVPTAQILCLLQLFVDLIFAGVRIRSYHLYRIIKHYQRMTGEHPSLFNAVVANYIKTLFQEFIANDYRPTAELAQLSSSRKNLTSNHLKLLRHEVKFTPIQSACTLSMFINLFCRLNHGSLAAGVERLFGEEDAKAMYLDYLTALTRKITQEKISISQKDIEILKVDVYGNLNIVAKGKLSEHLITKLVALAKNLLRVRTDISGIDQLPLKLLAQKLEQELLPLNLEEFEDQCRALSLGALSLHRRVAPLISSNLHYCNLFYLSGRNFQQNIEINKKLLAGTRQDIQNEVRRIGKEGVQGLRVDLDNGITEMVDSLLSKIESYHQLCSKQPEYSEKLYASFKILCINCLNTPEIIPYVLSKSVTVHNSAFPFLQFVVQTLKICLPLFCQFLAVITKTNWAFVSISKEEVVPVNFLLQLRLKQQLVGLFEQEGKSTESQYRFLPKALHFMQRFIPENRFKYYRFAHLNKEHYQTLMKEANRDFNLQLLQACQKIISTNQYLDSRFKPIFQIFVAGLENSLPTDASLDIKKLQTELKIRREFVGEEKRVYQKHEIIGSFKKLNAYQNRQVSTASSKQPAASKAQLALLEITSKVSQFQFGNQPTNDHKITTKLTKRVGTPRIDQDLIGFCQSKFLIQDSDPETSQPISSIINEQFKLFNQELEGKEFLKGVTAFPTQEGISLMMNTPDQPLLHTTSSHNNFNNFTALTNPTNSTEIEDHYLPTNQQDAIIDASSQSDAIVESLKDFQQASCEELVQFSSKAIEASHRSSARSGYCGKQPGMQQLGEGQAILHSDNILYSEIEINQEDGSMKLFEEDDSYNDPRSLQDTVSKDDILNLIQEYTLNPEAIKQIALKIKYLPTEELEKLQAQQSRQILYVLEAELRTRSIFPVKKEKTQIYDNLFIDEAKLFEKVRNRSRHEQCLVEIPVISHRFASQWLGGLLKKGAEGKMTEQKQFNSFIRTLLLQQQNVKLVLSAALQILTLNDHQFQRQLELTYSADKTPSYFKQLLLDLLFSALLEQRIGLPAIFFGYWSQSKARITSQSGKQEGQARVVEILLGIALKSPQKESLFLKKMLQYIAALNQTTRFTYPYLQIQDAIPIRVQIIEELSEKLRQRRESFCENQKLLLLFKVLTYLELKCLQQLLRVQFGKTAQQVHRVCEKEEQTLQQFQRQFIGAQHIETDRKAEIYWNLRKSKHLSEAHADIVLSRRILSDIISKVLPSVKANTFSFYYRQEDSDMKQDLAYLERKSWEARHYWERFELEQELQERKKSYETWKRSSINTIVKEEISPAFEEVSVQFRVQLRKSTGLLAELHELFDEAKDKHPSLFVLCCQFYLLMLAYETAKKEDEQSHYSLSLLKTLPSIQSTRETPGSRRRTSLSSRPNSILQGTQSDFSPFLKRFASFLPKSILELDPKDPLMAIHARYADTETKFKLLKQQNTLGEKVIEVSRQTIWQDTYAHLDESFGKHDIKIKIKGQLGIDYGGVTREWAALVVKEITNPNLGLFQLNANQLALQPSKLSYLIPNHLEIFHRLGIFIGKALKQGWLLQVNFTKSFLKHMLGATLYVEDLQDIDPYTAKGLLWILQNEVGDDLGFSFTFQEEMLQETRIFELVAGGSEVQVNNTNKKEYVKKLAYLKMTENIREQSMALMEGLQKIVPIQLLKLLTYKQIGKFLAGHSVVDVKEMKRWAKYQGWSEEDQTLEWFWECLGQKTQEEIAEFLFFVTGSYRVPYSGFERHPITINKVNCSKDYCPVAHTCFSIIDLPEYSSKQKLNQMLVHAIKQGRGFTVS